MVLLACIFMAGCTKNNSLEKEASVLLEESRDLHKRHLQIEARIDSLWDVTTAVLANNLPADMPPVDRDIFLKSRNAYHIRMFMSFDKLDPSIQEVVNMAAHEDESLADSIRILSEERLAFEKKKNKLLMELEKVDKETARSYAAQFRQIPLSFDM